MGVSLREEFRGKNFGFKHPLPHKFVTSEWNIPHTLYIVWRVFWALWHTGWIIRSIQLEISTASYEGEGAKWLIYLTNISYLILTLHSLMHAASVIYHTAKGKTEPQHFQDETTSWYHHVIWIFTSVGFNAAILVTVLYWALVFTELTYALSIMTHAVNSVYVLLDNFVSATPVRILHLIYGAIYGTSYILFTVIYHALDGTNSSGEPYIYKALDWSSPGSTAGLAVGVVAVALPLVHLFQFALYTLRVYIHENCCGSNHGNDSDPQGAGKVGHKDDIEMKAPCQPTGH